MISGRGASVRVPEREPVLFQPGIKRVNYIDFWVFHLARKGSTYLGFSSPCRLRYVANDPERYGFNAGGRGVPAKRVDCDVIRHCATSR